MTPRTSTADVLLAWMTPGRPYQVGVLAEQMAGLGHGRNDVDVALHRLLRRGHVMREGRGVYVRRPL